jgi:hypothetical protein
VLLLSNPALVGSAQPTLLELLAKLAYSLSVDSLLLLELYCDSVVAALSGGELLLLLL